MPGWATAIGALITANAADSAPAAANNRAVRDLVTRIARLFSCGDVTPKRRLCALVQRCHSNVTALSQNWHEGTTLVPPGYSFPTVLGVMFLLADGLFRHILGAESAGKQEDVSSWLAAFNRFPDGTVSKLGKA